MKTIDVELPEDLGQFVATQVATGAYDGASEFICSLVARAKQGHDRIEGLLFEGLNSGAPIPLDESEWQAMRREVRDNLAE
jgi:Arc/MetJ-type ribon-helix-helix transcriptional regulator